MSGRAAAEPPYLQVKPARDFVSGKAASEIPACHIFYGFCLPPTFIVFDESI